MPLTNFGTKKTYKRIIQLELNELSAEVAHALVRKGLMPNFAKMQTHFSYLKTSSETDYDKLEPWIQWVTAHTGKTFAEHQIFHLSDVHKLKHTQIWEALSAAGIESGIVGSMNIVRRDTEGGIFFPDPWAIKNETYPDSLRPLWELIASRVQTHATSKITPGDIIKGLKACVKFGLPIRLYVKMAAQIVSQKLNPKNKWKLAAVFDLFLTEIFKSIVKKTNYGFYTLFLNSAAHYQHHYWRAFDGTNFDPNIVYDDINPTDDPMTFGYQMYDKILGEVMALVGKDPDTLVVILSGLSQVPFTEKEAEGGMNYYRLNNHKAFAQTIGLGDDIDVFPLMSRDWQIRYPNAAAHKKAVETLQNLYVEGVPLFHLKEDTEGFIFIETSFTKAVTDQTAITTRDGQAVARFKEVFTNIAIKSGHHTGIGHLWLSEPHNALPTGTIVPLTSVYDFTLNTLGLMSQKRTPSVSAVSEA